MNLTKPYGPRDLVSGLDRDLGFIGVDERTPAHQLAPGFVSAAKNCRFRRKIVEPRSGITVLPWVKGAGLTPFTEVYGGAVFQDPNQSGEWILIAADGGVWKTRPNAIARAVPLPVGTTLTRDTFALFIQANSAIILLRGLGAAPLVCYDLEAGFMTVTQENEWEVQMQAATNRVKFIAHNLLVGDPVQFTQRAAPTDADPALVYTLPPGIVAEQTYYVIDTPNANEFLVSETPGGVAVTWNQSATDATVYDVTITVLDGAVPIAPAVDGMFVQNRLVLVNGKDTVLVSDIGDFTRYQPVQNVFRINEGDSYTIRKIYIFNEDTVVVGKDGAMLKVTGISGDLSNATGPLNVTQAYGMAAPSFGDLGKDLFWLNSELRITSLKLTELNQEQGTSEALSDPMVQTFGRINPLYARRARLTVFDSFLHVALPLDDANIVDTTNQVLNGFDPGSTTDLLPRYGIGGTYTVTGLTVGRRYQYRQGTQGNDLTLVNGTETLEGDCDFIAQGTSVVVTGLAADFVYAEVKWIKMAGVNTAVAVYDFVNQAWAGSDEGDNVVCVVDWLKFTYAGRKVLAFLGADGLLHLCNDGYEDEQLLPVSAPYADIIVDRLPADGDLLQVSYGNGNNFVTFAQNIPPAPGVWSCDTLANARATLFQALAGDLSGATAIDYGVRGALGTDPVTVAINGTIVEDGNFAWAFVDSHSGAEIQPVEIVTDVVTRGYPCQLDATTMKRFLALALQLAAWSPGYQIFTRTHGYGDETQYAPDPTGAAAAVTRDYLKYFAPHDKTDWTPDNSADDFNAPRRQDYAYPETGAGILLASGVNFDAEQQFVHRAAVGEQGLFMQVRLVNSNGRASILSAAMEAQEGQVLSGLEVN